MYIELFDQGSKKAAEYCRFRRCSKKLRVSCCPGALPGVEASLAIGCGLDGDFRPFCFVYLSQHSHPSSSTTESAMSTPKEHYCYLSKAVSDQTSTAA